MFLTMLRPTNTTCLRYLQAMSTTCWTLWTWLEKLATTIFPLASEKARSSAGATEISGFTKPGTSALVESIIRRSTPSSPSLANSRRFVSLLSRGSGSIFMSPVSMIFPAGVVTATARASGMEWVTDMKRRSKTPALTSWPSFTSMHLGFSLNSSHFASTRAKVSLDPIRGISGLSLKR